MGDVTKLAPFRGIFGLPPSSHVSDEMIINSMPVMEIIPCMPELATGQTLFKVKNAWAAYHTLLANNGFSVQEPIKIAFLADNFPTDTFTNDYGETFLQKFTDVASQGMAEISQITGSRGGIESLGKLEDWGSRAEKDLGGTMGTIAGGFGSGAGGLKKALLSLKDRTSGTMVGNVGEIVDKMIAGHRLDFPQIWRNSGFTPSYTATIRLYNPNPSSPIATRQYIIGPLAVILCLGLPQSDDGKTYSWPFFHKIKAKGIYNLDPAMITNITVIKGGDQQQIAYNQRLGMVDIRLDFGSLYTSIMAETEGEQSVGRPTVKNYLKSLEQEDTTLHKTRNQMVAKSKILAGVADDEGLIKIATSLASQNRERIIAKNDSIRRRKSQTVVQTNPTTRVSSETKAIQDDLYGKSPGGLLA
jgi:hypothetical protein